MNNLTKIIKNLEQSVNLPHEVIEEVVKGFNSNYDYALEYLEMMQKYDILDPAEAWSEWVAMNILDFNLNENPFDYATSN